MKVKIDTGCVWEKKERGAGSVIEVPVETYELNDSWMHPTDEELNDVEPAKEKAANAKDR